MVDERVRIELAFDGGQVLSLLVSVAAAEELEGALAAGTESAFPLEAEDGRYAVALRRVVYVKRFAREMRVGFFSQ
jgi:hypothetical protein